MSWHWVEVELLADGQKKGRIYHCCCTNTNHSGMPIPTSTVFPEGKAIPAPICPVVLRCGQKAGLHCSIATLPACTSRRLAYSLSNLRMERSSISAMHVDRSLVTDHVIRMPVTVPVSIPPSGALCYSMLILVCIREQLKAAVRCIVIFLTLKSVESHICTFTQVHVYICEI